MAIVIFYGVNSGIKPVLSSADDRDHIRRSEKPIIMAITPARRGGQECDAGMSVAADIAMYFPGFDEFEKRTFADCARKVKHRKRKTGLRHVQPGLLKSIVSSDRQVIPCSG
ncbi:hypothetical protein AUQ41_15985 [Thalassospira sp. MCCC 1A02898]|nr:hypothetical protein AUQ41_15985 [Thalassospira sp. MCCC 1A02898]